MEFPKIRPNGANYLRPHKDEAMDITPPGTPRGLTAVPTKRGVLLKWIPKGERDFAGYNLYRQGPGDKQFVELHEGSIQAHSWVDAAVKMARESHLHKRDNMVDAVGYLALYNQMLDDLGITDGMKTDGSGAPDVSGSLKQGNG